jgi:hypothetical protein
MDSWAMLSKKPLISASRTQDPVGLTLLYRLVVYSLLDAVFSAVDIMFTRLLEARPTNPSTPLLGRACQPDLALW